MGAVQNWVTELNKVIANRPENGRKQLLTFAKTNQTAILVHKKPTSSQMHRKDEIKISD